MQLLLLGPGCGGNPEPDGGDDETLEVGELVVDPTLAIGDRVQVTIQRARVRSSGMPVGEVIGAQPLGAAGTLVAGPAVTSNGGVRWSVDFDEGTDGWVWQSFLKEVGGQPAAAKWQPGHYIMGTPDDLSPTGRAFKYLSGPNAALFQGYSQIISWYQVETARGAYDWSGVHRQLDALPPGKKALYELSHKSWGAAPHGAPAYMLGNPAFAGGEYVDSGTHEFAKIHVPAVMDRYLELFRAFAKEFDGDDRVVMVRTGELAYPAGGRSLPDYDRTVAHQQYLRLANEVPPMFKRTPTIMLANWYPHGTAVQFAAFAEATLTSGGGFGGPDLVAPEARLTDGWSLLAKNRGKWASFIEVQWNDLIPPNIGTHAPMEQLDRAETVDMNYIGWIPVNRRDGSRSGAPDGIGFEQDVIPYLLAHPTAGISSARPANLR